MIDLDPDAKLQQIGARYTVNNLGKSDQTESYIRSVARRTIESQLASVVAGHALQVREGVYSTEYEIRLYVLTPDQLEKYVQRRAERLAYGRPQVIEQSYAPK